jgi:hypothetical protein
VGDRSSGAGDYRGLVTAIATAKAEAILESLRKEDVNPGAVLLTADQGGSCGDREAIGRDGKNYRISTS